MRQTYSNVKSDSIPWSSVLLAHFIIHLMLLVLLDGFKTYDNNNIKICYFNIYFCSACTFCSSQDQAFVINYSKSLLQERFRQVANFYM